MLEEFVAGYTRSKPLPTKNLAGTIKDKPNVEKSLTKPDKNPLDSSTNRTSIAVQPVSASLTDGKPQGMFYMQKYWIATRYLEKSCWYFAPDGKYYENLTSGFSPQELAAHEGAKGTYEVSRGNMLVTPSNGSTTEAKLEIVPGGFNWNTGMFLPVLPIRADKELVGTYEGGNSLGGGGNSVIVSKTIRFDADGTFQMSGVTSLQSTGEGTQATAGNQSQVNGRWKQEGFLLSLTTGDGTSAKHIVIPFFDPAAADHPERLFIGGTIYKRQ